MDTDLREVIEQIHASPTGLAAAISGAGSTAATWLLSVAGASRTVIDIAIPYSRKGLTAYIGWEPEQHVSTSTAAMMASAAYARALHLRDTQRPVIGLGCTAAVATDRQKRGDHRGHVAVAGETETRIYSLTMRKGLRSRAQEEELISRLVLQAAAQACGATGKVPISLADGEAITEERLNTSSALGRLIAGDIDRAVCFPPDVFVPAPPIRAALLCGSFSPLHEGHVRLAEAAKTRLEMPVLFEVSIGNVDKPSLAADEIRRRTAQFAPYTYRVTLNREPLYCDKAALYPGSTFILGYDTAHRLVDPAYYSGSRQDMIQALDIIRQYNCRFLIAGRLSNGVFHTLADLPIPPGYTDLFDGLSQEDFRMDISSTEIRERSQNKE